METTIIIGLDSRRDTVHYRWSEREKVRGCVRDKEQGERERERERERGAENHRGRVSSAGHAYPHHGSTLQKVNVKFFCAFN
jgi:hypothetical protein